MTQSKNKDVALIKFSTSNAIQLLLPLQHSSTPERKQVHPLRKRHRAEKIAPGCPL